MPHILGEKIGNFNWPGLKYFFWLIFFNKKQRFIISQTVLPRYWREIYAALYILGKKIGFSKQMHLKYILRQIFLIKKQLTATN